MARTAPESGPVVQLTRTLPAPRERVFRAWTDPAEIQGWLVPEGTRMLEARADVRVGGDFRFSYRAADGQAVYIVGTYVEVEPPERLAFTWLFEGIDFAETLVTVELRQAGDGTELKLTHERLATRGWGEFHLAGWTSVLDRLPLYLSS